MYTLDVWAMIILVLYSITLCGVPRFLVTAFLGARGQGNNRLLLMRFFIYLFLLKFLFELDCCE